MSEKMYTFSELIASISNDDLPSFKKMVTCKEDLSDGPRLDKRVMTRAYEERRYPILHYMTEIGFELDAEISRTEFANACTDSNKETINFILSHVDPNYLELPVHARFLSETGAPTELLATLISHITSKSDKHEVLVECIGAALYETDTPTIRMLIPLFEKKITNSVLVSMIFNQDLSLEELSSLVGHKKAVDGAINHARSKKIISSHSRAKILP